MRETNLPRQIASRLRRGLREYRSGVLPSLAELARAFGVSRGTVARAARLLAAEGLLTISRGRRIRLRGAGPVELPEHRSSWEVLRERFRGDIAHGRMRAGERFPKVSYLAAHHRVSPHTVVRALRSLASEGLVHKAGKAWVCGGRNPLPRGRQPVRPKAMILLQKAPSSWAGLYTSSRTERFCRSFEEEAESRGIELITLVSAEEHSYEGTFPAGREGFARVVRKLDDRYLGTLVAASGHDLPDLRGLVEWIVQHRRPVVWFDRLDEQVDWRPPGKGRELAARCHFVEEPAVDAALRFLADRGHRSVSFFRDTDQPWQLRRAEMILARAPVVAPRLQVSVPSPGAVSLAERRWRDYQARLALSGYPITRRKIHHRLLAYHLTKRYTALIAPNDRVGHWLRSSLGKYEAGGGRGVSLISFDNSLHSRRLPITTVDFGFRDLGYKAFHFLLGDLPVARGHGGDIPAVPYVVDRGSVMHRGGAEARSGPV